jgi:hypothetical protein
MPSISLMAFLLTFFLAAIRGAIFATKPLKTVFFAYRHKHRKIPPFVALV